MKSTHAAKRLFYFLSILFFFVMMYFVMPGKGLSQDENGFDKSLEQLQQKMEKMIENGQAPTEEMMQEVQKILDQMQKDMQDDSEESENEEDDPADNWVEIPYKGHIYITRSISYNGAFAIHGSEAHQSISVNDNLRANITKCETIRDKEGEIIGYQPVGNVMGTWNEKEVVTAEDITIRSTFFDENTVDHPFDSESTGWCVLQVNPAKKKYRLKLPSIFAKKNSVLTVATVQGHSEEEDTQVLKHIWGWTKDGKSTVKDRDYEPGASFISDSETQTRTMVVPSITSPMGEYDKNTPLAPGISYEEFAKATVKYHVTWTLQIADAKAKVILEPEGYDKWMPELTANSYGNILKIKARITEPEGASGRIEFTLYDVSNEPGKCMNFPFDNPDTDPDLSIHPTICQPSMLIDQEKGTAKTETDVTEAVIAIQAQDWGASGKVKAITKVMVGSELVEVPAVYEATGADFVTIPRDEDDNSIADAWEEQYGVFGKGGDADEDNNPESERQGDGLSLYEEYRGMLINTRHTRFDPTLKELFIHDPDGLAADSFFESAAAPLKVYYLSVLEMNASSEQDADYRVVNRNSGKHHLVDQHGVVVKKSQKKKVPGWCGEGDDEPGPPRTVDPYIGINIDYIRASIKGLYEKYRNEICDAYRDKHGTLPGPEWLEEQVSQCVRQTTTHELGHAISVNHHYNTVPGPAQGQYNVDPSAGGLYCVMRYPVDYADETAPVVVQYHNDVVDYLKGDLRWPFLFCSGDANDCKGQFVVTDEE